VASVRKVNRRAGAALVALLALVVPVLGPTHLARAQSQTDRQRQIDDEINSLRNLVSEASAEEAKLLIAIDASSAAKRALDAKVAALDGQIATVQQKLNAAQAKLAAFEEEQRVAEVRLAESQKALNDARNKLAAYAIAAYTGRSEAMQLLTSTIQAHSMDELVTRRSYLKAVGNNQAEIIALGERLRDEVKDLNEQLKELTKDAQAQAQVVAGQKAELESSRSEQDSARAEVAAELARNNDLRAQVLARKDEFEEKEEQLERESEAITAQLRARAEAERAERARAAAAAAASGSSTTTASGGAAGGASGGASGPAVGSRNLIAPIAGNPPITSSFGYRVHPIYGTTRLHTGVDIGADTGTAIRAAGSGTVVSAGWMEGYGNATILDHGNGLATLYAHQSAMLVSSGGTVSQGQTIGRVGCTGSCTGPHLHFEVRIDGTPVDPLPYIR
jgi:murein DD-endopeptidase MepM/ murein hydrolase activator NlpD